MGVSARECGAGVQRGLWRRDLFDDVDFVQVVLVLGVVLGCPHEPAIVCRTTSCFPGVAEVRPRVPAIVQAKVVASTPAREIAAVARVARVLGVSKIVRQVELVFVARVDPAASVAQTRMGAPDTLSVSFHLERPQNHMPTLSPLPRPQEGGRNRTRAATRTPSATKQGVMRASACKAGGAPEEKVFGSVAAAVAPVAIVPAVV